MPYEQGLLGCWMAVDQTSQIEFKPAGELIYTILGEEKDQQIFMTFEVQGDHIISNQPSHPQQETTRFSLPDLDHLILEYDHQKFEYYRVGSVSKA